MAITKKTVAEQITAYLHHKITVVQLVDWAQFATRDGELAEQDRAELRSVLARLGESATRRSGISWEDCQDLLRKLGYSAKIEVVAT